MSSSCIVPELARPQMATVSIPYSPHSLAAMSSRRVPLSSNPNAANSPYNRGVVAAAAVQKQKRSYANLQREEAYGQPPPAKRQMIETQQKSPSRTSITQAAEGRVFTRKTNGSQTTAFEKKLEAARVRPSQQQTVTRAEKHSEENLETIRQWQRHYRKVFPKFVFYFESVPEEARTKYTKQLAQLGAREEKFFSNAVTHVVTTRSIPTPLPPSPVEAVEVQAQNGNVQTINPILLDRSSEPITAHFDGQPGRAKFTFEVPLVRRAASNSHDIDVRKQQVRNSDVLVKARDLGMKIWALEKLQRMMTTMFDTDTGVQMAHGHNTRSAAASVEPETLTRSRRTADLSQLLRNERINGPSDRDPTVASRELTLFKGPFIYIHDIDEKQRPVMVREYAKVSNKEDGDWPQFRSVANGKCPFVEEVDHDRRDAEREQLRKQKVAERERAAAASVPRTRAATAEASKMEPPVKQVLAENDVANRRTAVPSAQVDAFFAPDLKPTETEVSSTKGPQNAFVSRAAQGRLFGGEPVASGLQQSNITSAIRSQMISSTAAAPGAKAGTSKEVHGLQRKVLERNSGPTSLGLTSSHRMTDIASAAAAAKEDSKAARRKAQERLGFVDEDPTPTELEEARRAEAARKAKAVQKRKSEKRDPKPGYCENCMDKFEDFDEHIQSRKHRKFAEKSENWAELDALLAKLVRRPLEDDSQEYVFQYF